MTGPLASDGYASLFGVDYPVGSFTEEFRAGSFKRDLARPDLDVVLRTEHSGLPLARTTSGTLHLGEDAKGLRVHADLDRRDPDVKSLQVKFERGDLREMSIAFRVERDQWNDDLTRRSVLEASLHRGDVSIVTYGASPSTSSTLRTAGSFTLEQRAVAVEMTRGVAVGRGPITAIGGVQQRAANQFGQHVECADCGGSGECPTCDGTGTVWQSNDDDRSEKRRDGTDKEVQELGRQGLALWVGDHYAWPIVDAVDLDAAVQSLAERRAAPGSSAVKRWIILRARALRRLDLLPDTWGVKRSAVVLAPNDTFDLEREWEQLRLRRGRR